MRVIVKRDILYATQVNATDGVRYNSVHFDGD